MRRHNSYPTICWAIAFVFLAMTWVSSYRKRPVITWELIELDEYLMDSSMLQEKQVPPWWDEWYNTSAGEEEEDPWCPCGSKLLLSQDTTNNQERKKQKRKWQPL